MGLNREDVIRKLNSNFSTGGWTGPESNYLSKKIKSLGKNIENETDPNVVVWTENRIQMLRERIRSTVIKEERRGY